MRLSQLNVLLIVASVIALTLIVVVATNTPATNSIALENVKTGAVLQANTSSSSSSTITSPVYGENKLVLSLNTATTAERSVGEKFIIGLEPQLLEETPVATADFYIGFNPTLVKATRVIELTTFAESEKAIDNANGLITFNGIAANNGRFTNGQILLQIEFEVITEDNLLTTISVLGNSTLGTPNTLSHEGFGKLNVTINNPPVVTISSSASSISSSVSSSLTSSSVTSQFTNDTVTQDNSNADLRTVFTSVLATLAVISAAAAGFIWFRQRRINL